MKFAETTVADIMSTAVISLHPDATIERAHEEMMVADIRHLPIIDDRGRMVGIVSDRDIRRALGMHRHGKHKVAEFMTREVLNVAPRTFAREAAALMLERKIGALPVLDDTLALVGIITETDFLRLAFQALGGTLP
jgi:CBS domain-containing protein